MVLSLFDTFTVLKPDQLQDLIPVTPSLYESLDSDYTGFQGHVLVSAHQFSEDWGVWEMHPAGDELVILLFGRAELVRREGHSESISTVTEPGQFVVIPKGVWHTARVSEPTAMLFITPGAGTQNLTQPPD